MTITTTMKSKKKLISQAIEVLREVKNKYEESGKKALFEDDSSTIFLQVLLKKIPKRNGTQMIKVNLPHSLLKDTEEVCMIMGDSNKNDRKADTEPDVFLYKALLEKHGVTQISKVVTLRQLRTDYKPYADKQKLLAAYAVFLADNKIYECLPRILGKFFYKKRKFPHKIDMKSSNLKQQIEKALSTKMFYVTGSGNSCCSEVASLDMSNSEILANVMEMINTVSKEMPGAWDNIMGIYIKTGRSESIPVYVSYGNPNDVILKEEEIEDDFIVDELTTKPNVSVKVLNDGRVELFTSKKSQESCLDEIIKEEVEKKIKSDFQEKSKKRSLKSELKEQIKETSKIKIQKNLDDEVDKSEKSIEVKKSVIDDDISVADPGNKRNKSGKKKAQRNLDDEVIESETNISKKSKKEKRIVKDLDICIADSEKDLPEKKKSAFKRKRELSESGTKVKEPFLSFESPKQNTKKRKVDSENLKKQQHFKNARKKILQQKTKKNFKA